MDTFVTRAPSPALWIATLACLLVANHVHAAPTEAELAKQDADKLFESDFAIDDQDPERGIPTEEQRNAKPLEFGKYLMALSDKAQEASAKGDHQGAAKYYRTITKAVPDASVGFVKLCAEYEALGQRDKAEQSCGEALARTRVTVDDFAHYVRLVLAQTTPLSKQQVASVDAAVAHLKTDAAGRTISAQLACDVGMRLNDATRLAGCTSELQRLAPNDLKTISYQWAFALRRGDMVVARQAVSRAKQLGMPAAGIAQMEDGIRAAASISDSALPAKSLVWVGAAALAALCLLAWFLATRRRTARSGPLSA